MKKIVKFLVPIVILLVGAVIYITVFNRPSNNVFSEDKKYKFDYKSKIGYVMYTTDRAILYVQEGYMTEEEIEEFGKSVDRGVNEIEEYLGMKFDTSHYTTDKVVYYLNGDGGGSQLAGGYSSKNLNTEAIVYLYNAKKKICPYIHETTHIIAWNFSSLWVREGLAVYLNDKLKGDPTVPNGGKDIDELTKKYLNDENKSALDLVGTNGVPYFKNNQERLVFYLFSSSLVKYLEQNIGIEKLMKIYESDDTEKSIKELTGESVMEWKQKWMDSLGV